MHSTYLRSFGKSLDLSILFKCSTVRVLEVFLNIFFRNGKDILSKRT